MGDRPAPQPLRRRSRRPGTPAILVAGLDVGRVRDRTALARLGGPAGVSLRQLPPLPLSAQADALAPLLAPCALVAVDCTGLGLGLGETLHERKHPVVQVQITAGRSVNSARKGHVTVGKEYLIGRLLAEVHRGLKVPPQEPLAAALRSQMAAMLPKPTRRGYKIEAAGGHDDLVLAMALALLGRDLHERRGNL